MIRSGSALFTLWLFALCASLGSAANVRWTGNAQDVPQVSTITVAGTWATGDTATLTINKKSLTVTLGTAVATTDVAAAIAAAVDAGSATEDLVGNETRNAGGAAIPEFLEIDASATGSTVTLSSAVAGVPFTVTRSEVTAGSGALGAVTAVTAATGKHWLNNADNYEGGALPVDNDVLYVDQGSTSILYALDYFRANAIDLDVYVSGDFAGQLGNPPQNPGGYQEYRSPRYFQFRGGSKTLEFVEGASGGSGQGRCWIDFQDQVGTTVNIRAARGSGTAPTIFLAGADATNALGALRIDRGNVALEPDDAETAGTKYARYTGVTVGVAGGDSRAAHVVIGRNCRLAKSTQLFVNGGTCVTYAGTKSGADAITTQVFAGGVLEMRGGATYHDFLAYPGGVLYPSTAATAGTVTLWGGALDYSRSAAAWTPTALKLYAGSTLRDPNLQGSTAIDVVGCRLSDVTLELAPNRKITLTGATP